MTELIERYGTLMIYFQWLSSVALMALLIGNWDNSEMRSLFLLPAIVSAGVTACLFMVARVVSGAAGAYMRFLDQMNRQYLGVRPEVPQPLHIIPKENDEKPEE